MTHFLCLAARKFRDDENSREPPENFSRAEVRESLVVAKFSHREPVRSCQCYFFPDINLHRLIVYSTISTTHGYIFNYIQTI